jgi:hypothetical protein
MFALQPPESAVAAAAESVVSESAASVVSSPSDLDAPDAAAVGEENENIFRRVLGRGRRCTGKRQRHCDDAAHQRASDIHGVYEKRIEGILRIRRYGRATTKRQGLSRPGCHSAVDKIFDGEFLYMAAALMFDVIRKYRIV